MNGGEGRARSSRAASAAFRASFSSNGLASAVVASLVVCAILAPVPKASADDTLAISWPKAWGSPLSSSTVYANTIYGAFSKGCPNADTSHYYTYYLEKGRKEHLGLDLKASADTSVYAIADGTFTNVGDLWGTDWAGVALIRHAASDGSFTAVYAHLTISTNPRTGKAWKIGDTIRKGERVGKVANMTIAPPHLHFGLAPSSQTSVPGTSNSSGTKDCPHQPGVTTDPLKYLETHVPPNTPPVVPPSAESGGIRADFDGDGNDDVGAFYPHGDIRTRLYVWHSTGSGFSAPTLKWDSTRDGSCVSWAGWDNTKPVAGDFNGDGKDDIGAFYPHGDDRTRLCVWYSTGTGFAAPAVKWDSGAGGWIWKNTKVL